MPVTTELKKQIALKLSQLKQEINYHNNLYHRLDNPEITDQAYDKLFQQLLEIESQHPELQTPDSPSQRVGDKPLTMFKQVKHEVAMLSLDKVFDGDDLNNFETRIYNRLGEEKSISYSCEPKIDGIAVSLMYEEGMLVRAYYFF